MSQFNFAPKEYRLELLNYFKIIQEVTYDGLVHCAANNYDKAVFVHLIPREKDVLISLLFSLDQKNTYSLANVTHGFYPFAEIFALNLATSLSMFIGEKTNTPWTVRPINDRLFGVIPYSSAKLKDSQDKT